MTSITDYRGPINDALEKFFASAAGRLDVELSAHSARALERLHEYTMRPGKRIRGALASASYDAATGSKFASAGLQLGVALELMQSYLLIVDDVMDRSELRRGEPTVHELYAKDALVSEHEANMMAVNVGLLAQHFANLVVLDIEAEPGVLTRVLSVLHRNTMVTGFGQLDDLHHRPGRDLTEADVVRQYAHKSSYYTFVNPLQLGLVLAGQGNEATLQACVKFGEPAGVAFQLHDDMLGVFADTVDSGKPNVDDIREGKYTLLMHYALEHADETGKKILERALGNTELTVEDLEQVRAVLVQSGSKKYVLQQMQKHEQAALDAVTKQSVISTSFSDQLRELLHYATTRQQ